MASAFPNLSEIVTTTLRNRTGELADNMSRNNAALLRLSRRGNLKTFSGGRTIVQELNYADNQTYQWYSGYQTLNIAPSQVFSAAEYPIRQAAVAVSISGLEELQNSDEALLQNLLWEPQKPGTVSLPDFIRLRAEGKAKMPAGIVYLKADE